MSKIIDEHGREISEHGEIVAYRPEPFRILDVYGDEAARPAERRLDWIACVSAGRRVQRGDKWIPEVSRDGTIYVSGDPSICQGLIDALASRNGKGLTIAFPSDDLDRFIVQRFACRTATELQVYGEADGLTEIKDGAHTTYLPGTPQFKALRKRCKVETHVLFCLAKWVGDRSICTFPDGATGRYAIRFTSRNSLRNLVGRLEEIKREITGGRLAGIPFELFLTYRDVAAPDGKSRNVPIWSIEFKPPQTIELTTGNLGQLLSNALSEGERLRLLPAPQYSIDDAIAEGTDVDLDLPAEALDVMNGEPPCDARYWEAAWFVSVRGTRFASDEMRADYLRSYTGGDCDSLADYLAGATEAEASGLLAALGKDIEADRIDSRRAALEANGFNDPRGPVIDHETGIAADEMHADPAALALAFVTGSATPEEQAPAKETPAEKSARRREMESRMKSYLSAGAALGMDLAPFEFDESTADGALEARGVKLAAAIRKLTDAAEPAKA